MPLNVSNTKWSTTLNVHYGACLGVVFAFLVPDIVPNESGNVIYFHSRDSAVITIAMLLYFFIDCIVANTREGEYKASTLGVLFALIWIWFLGYCIVIGKIPQPQTYIALPIYIVGARLYQIFLYTSGKFIIDEGASVIGALISGASLLIALIFLWNGAIAYYRVVESSDILVVAWKYRISMVTAFDFVVVFILSLKIVESTFFIRSTFLRA
jgi:hypothetical protein